MLKKPIAKRRPPMPPSMLPERPPSSRVKLVAAATVQRPSRSRSRSPVASVPAAVPSSPDDPTTKKMLAAAAMSLAKQRNRLRSPSTKLTTSEGSDNPPPPEMPLAAAAAAVSSIQHPADKKVIAWETEEPTEGASTSASSCDGPMPCKQCGLMRWRCTCKKSASRTPSPASAISGPPGRLSRPPLQQLPFPKSAHTSEKSASSTQNPASPASPTSRAKLLPWPCEKCGLMPWLCVCLTVSRTREEERRAYQIASCKAGIWADTEAIDQEASKIVARDESPEPVREEDTWACPRCKSLNSRHELLCQVKVGKPLSGVEHVGTELVGWVLPRWTHELLSLHRRP